jgi:succinate dehydrogenase flavin-adding protein (antitoxin of CptAB toxin-antitoxin module)
MKNLTEIRNQVHLKFLKWRRTQRIINSKEFDVAFESSDEDAKKKLEKILESENDDQLHRWVKDEIEANIGDNSIRQLRLIASQCHIPRYGSMIKSELLMAIARVTDDKTRLNSQADNNASGVRNTPTTAIATLISQKNHYP